MLKTATKWVSRTIGKSGFGFYMCKIKVETNATDKRLFSSVALFLSVGVFLSFDFNP
jgi:hypothetical protein